MKKALLIGGIILVVLAGVYFFAEKADSPDVVLPEGAVEAEGVVTAVDLEGAMLDGPFLVTMTDASGEELVIAVPSMGIKLCAASEDIANPYTLEVGDEIAVLGTEDESGRIVPCEDASHYLRLIEN